MRCVHQDFFDATIRRMKLGKLGLIKKKHIFIFVIELKEAMREFIDIAPDASETGRVHSAINTDAHDEEMRNG